MTTLNQDVTERQQSLQALDLSEQFTGEEYDQTAENYGGDRFGQTFRVEAYLTGSKGGTKSQAPLALVEFIVVILVGFQKRASLRVRPEYFVFFPGDVGVRVSIDPAEHVVGGWG